MFSNSSNNKAGRPVSIDIKEITKKCLDFYVLNGIDNQSFNNVIKHAGVSKGSVYRLYGSEDALQKAALIEYFNTFVKERMVSHYKNQANLKNIIMDVTSGLISNRYRCCLYHRSRMEKYKLGKETKKYISQIDREVEKNFKLIVERDFFSKNKKLSKVEVTELARYVINGITTINLMKLNNNSHKSILSYANILLKTLKKI